jgi:hypothetical protein
VNRYEPIEMDRKQELDACYKANLENEEIEEVVIVGSSSKPTYNDFFFAINKVAKDDDISIIANGDIYFEAGLRENLRTLTNKVCYALSRWNIRLDGMAELFERWDSQDTWIFRGQVKGVFGDFCVGTLGCDNRIVHELRKAGYMVLNPSKTIKTYHVHSGALPRNAHHDLSVTVPPPYEYVISEELRPFLSIVTRQHPSRPTMFEKCRASVLMQKDDDYEHVILKDLVGVGANKANLMFHANKQLVRGRYIFILDDDDILTSDEFVGDMKKIVEDNRFPGIVFLRMMINDTLYPTEHCWGKDKLVVCHVGSFNLVMRSDLWQENIQYFSDQRIGDFLFFDSVMQKKPSVYWQDKLYGGTQRVSRGKAE